MWNSSVTNSDTVLRHLQSGVSETAGSHPLVIVACAAIGLALVMTVAADSQMRELDVLREMAEAARVLRAQR